MRFYLLGFILLSHCLYAIDIPENYPDSEFGIRVKLGADILSNTDTHPLTKDLVGNSLKCVSCHLPGDDGKPGTKKSEGTFLQVAAHYPAYKNREEVIETLQDRIDNCFMRSMDGERPIIDSKASIAMFAYISWLSNGEKISLDHQKQEVQDPFKKIVRKATSKNYKAGQKLYTKQCASCHGLKGQGVTPFPPLWGKGEGGRWRSYNAGAGMSKLPKAARWIQSNMPYGQGESLTLQESVDLSIYINAQERASFDLSEKLVDLKSKGYYNSKVLHEKHSVETNFKLYGLELQKIRGE